MSRLQRILNEGTSEAWRVALLLGLASTPFTAYLYWQSPARYAFVPVFVAGLLGGWLSNRSGLQIDIVGIRTGLVGGLPTLWPLLDMLVFISDLAQPIWFSILQVVLLLFGIALIIGLSALTGMIGAIIGDWMIKKTHRNRAFGTGS